MQMQAIRFVDWIELISATSFTCAVIINYRQASDRQLRPRMPSNGPFTSRGIVNQLERSAGKSVAALTRSVLLGLGFIFDSSLTHRSLIIKYLKSDGSVLIHLQHNRELESQMSQ